ncbi:putative Ig domain-containing protein, partial [Corynebacterium lehmanniae]|nr:putative Ig domain-containing protein [Corynebacterium lehmanniae]
DEDDDNDGFTDEQEKEAGTDPKDPNSKPETPVVPDASVVTDPVTVVEGQETDPFDTANNVPEGGKVSVDNLPGGLTVDPETGKVTGTPENLDDWGKDEEERDVTVTVTITDADGNEVAKEDKVITVQRDTDGDGIPDVTDEDDDNDGFTDEQEKEAGTDPKDPNSKPSEGGGVKDTTPPTVDAIKPGDKTISGTGDRPNEDIIVNLPDGTKVETETDKNGKWTIEVPAGVELKPGDKVTVSDGDGNKATEQVGIDTGKCVATSLGFGLPLLALIPLGLATQMEIPGLSNVVADANAQLQAANTRIQQQLGLFNPEIAAQVDAANRQLAQFGTDIGTVAGGLALIAAGILAGTLIYDNCSPNGGGSSVKDLELKGSSGKTYAGSSKKEDKAGEKAADKK